MSYSMSGNVKGTKLPVEVLDSEEVTLLADQCSRRVPTGIRNRALILVLFKCQLRISEALALKPSDLNEGRGVLNVRNGKGGKQRQVSIDPGTIGEIKAWLSVREASGHKPIFCTLRGGTMKTAYVRELLPRLAEKAGIHKRVHAHGLRHSGASALLDKGASLSDIQQQLGHSSPSVTDTYLHSINPKGRAERLSALWD